ncbi:MAG: phenylacetate--CoA ligase family protein [Nocardioidaceae bacterium]
MPSYGPEVLGPPSRPDHQQHWDPEAQTMDPGRRRELQLDRLRELVGKVLDGAAPLFRRKLDEAGITSPHDIADLADLDRVPVTRKQELRDSEAEHPPLGDYRFTPAEACVRVGQSTGTTGTPTVTLLTRHDLWLEYESAARNWWRNGWRPGQTVTHCHPAYMYGGGAMLSGSLEYFGFLTLWVPPPDTDELAEQAIRTWQRIHPDLQLVALSQHRFQEVAAKLGVDLVTDCGLPDFQMGGFGRGLLPLMTAGFECYAYIGGADGTCDGSHLHEDWAVVQAIDPETGREVPEGRWGNLVVTTLDRDNGLLRYDLEEAAMLESGDCPLGETSRRGFWGGRFKDLLSSQGRHFQVSDLERAVASVAELTTPTLEFVVVNPKGSAEPLRLKAEVGADLAGANGDVRGELAARVRAAVQEALGVKADVEVVDRETLPRSGYKLARVVEG